MNNVKRLLRSPLIINSVIASLDQATLSALSFLVSIILIKNVPKGDYGYYSIAFAISLFVISIQNSVVTTPLTVLLITKTAKEKQSYPAALYFGQFFVVPSAVFLSLIVVGILYALGLDLAKTTIAGALSLASIGILFREFLRGYYFANQSPSTVLKLDVFYTATYLGLILGAYVCFDITVTVVFLFMGMSAFAVSAFFRRSLGWKFERKSINESYKENWKYGRWALLGVLVTHIQRYSYLYLLGGLLGSLAVAEVSASRLFFMPLLLVTTGWGKIVLPYGSKLRESHQLERFFREQIIVSIVIALTMAIYASLLLIFSEFLRNFLLTEKYERGLNLIVFWGAIFIMHFIAMNASYGLQVIKDFSVIAKINIVTMFVTICSAYLLIKSYGIEGALVSLLLGDILTAIAFWWVFTLRLFAKVKEIQSKFRKDFPGRPFSKEMSVAEKSNIFN